MAGPWGMVGTPLGEEKYTLHAWDTVSALETETGRMLRGQLPPRYNFVENIHNGLFWYFLTNSSDEIVAECTVTWNDEYSRGIFQIDDVLVPEEHQRKGYCVKLITKVFEHYHNKNERIRVTGDTKSGSAGCYKKVAEALASKGVKGVTETSLLRVSWRPSS